MKSNWLNFIGLLLLSAGTTAQAFVYPSAPNASVTINVSGSDGAGPGYTDLPIAGTASQSYGFHTPSSDITAQVTLRGQELISSGSPPSLQTIVSHDIGPISTNLQLTYYALVSGTANSTALYDFSGKFVDNLITPNVVGQMGVSTFNSIVIKTDDFANSPGTFANQSFGISLDVQRTLNNNAYVSNTIIERADLGVGAATLSYRGETGQIYTALPSSGLTNNNRNPDALNPAFSGKGSVQLDANGRAFIQITLLSKINGQAINGSILSNGGLGALQMLEYVDPQLAIDPETLALNPNASLQVLQGIGNSPVNYVSPVPEPASCLLALTGLAAIIGVKRRRQVSFAT